MLCLATSYPGVTWGEMQMTPSSTPPTSPTTPITLLQLQKLLSSNSCRESQSFTTASSSILSGFEWIKGKSSNEKLLKGFCRSLRLHLFSSSPCIMSTGFEQIWSRRCEHVGYSPQCPGGEIRGIWMVILTKEGEIKPFSPSREAKASLDLYGNQLQG